MTLTNRTSCIDRDGKANIAYPLAKGNDALLSTKRGSVTVDDTAAFYFSVIMWNAIEKIPAKRISNSPVVDHYQNELDAMKQGINIAATMKSGTSILINAP